MCLPFVRLRAVAGAHKGRPYKVFLWLPAQRPAATIGAMYTPYFIRAEWEAEAAVWVATSNDVPGLATEADTLEALAAKLRTLVPELLALNGE